MMCEECGKRPSEYDAPEKRRCRRCWVDWWLAEDLGVIDPQEKKDLREEALKAIEEYNGPEAELA